MKIIPASKNKGFTLIELMVSMVVTVILLTILFNVTALSSDNFTRAKGKLKMSRVADQVFDQLEIDIASAVISNSDKHWFYVGEPIQDAAEVGDGLDFPNATSLIFYTAAIDKYDGIVGVENIDLGGDVSIVNYKQDFINPLANLTGVSGSDERKPLLFRYIFSPKNAFNGITSVAASSAGADITNIWEIVWENAENSAGDPLELGDDTEDFNFDEVLGDGVFGMTTGFEIEFKRNETTSDGSTVTITERKTIFIRPGLNEDGEATEASEGIGTFLTIGVNGIDTDATDIVELLNDDDVFGLRVQNMILSLTLLDEIGMNYISRLAQGTADVGQFGDEDERRSNLIKEHGFTFTRIVPF